MQEFEQNYRKDQSQDNKTNKYFTRCILPASVIFLSYYFYHKTQKDTQFEQKYQDSINVSYKSVSSNPESIFLSLFNYKNKEQIILYFPFLALSLIQMPFLISNMKFLSLFTIHMVSQTAFMFMHEKYYTQNNKNFVIPKNNGSSLALFFSSFLASYKINSGYFGIKFLPFWVYPVFISFFEYYELRDNYTREISRQAHIFAILNGLLWGLIFRKI